MLILTRRPEEEIKIGESITIKILSIRGNQVRIGIDAPDDVSIFRKEIYEKIPHEDTSEDEEKS